MHNSEKKNKLILECTNRLRTTDYVYKKSFRKVKLRVMESRLAKTVVRALTFPWLFTQSILPTEKEGYARRYPRQPKLNSEFQKKKELEEISICSFKPIRSTELKKILLVFVRSVKFLSDATIPFQIKPWEYED